MSRKTLVFGSVMALAIGISLFAVPCISRADTIITAITVTNATGGNFTGGAAGNTWVFAPITLTAGQSLVLTQNQNGAGSTLPSGQPGFNFDSSENGGTAAGQYTVKVNGTDTFLDTSTSATAGVLNDSGVDLPGSTTQNEAANWVKIGGVAGSYDLYVGYADTLHSDACKDGGNCLPFSAGPPTVPNTIWDGTGGSTAATHFLGHASNLPGYPASPHCNVEQLVAASYNCFDAGSILIVSTVVPEPVTMFLGGTGLLLLGYAARRRLFGMERSA